MVDWRRNASGCGGNCCAGECGQWTPIIEYAGNDFCNCNTAAPHCSTSGYCGQWPNGYSSACGDALRVSVNAQEYVTMNIASQIRDLTGDDADHQCPEFRPFYSIGCFDATCAQSTQSSCVDGTYNGDGTLCDGNPCGGGGGMCPDGESRDCNGRCFPDAWDGDGFCDDGARTWNGEAIYLNCDEFNCDDCDAQDCDGGGVPTGACCRNATCVGYYECPPGTPGVSDPPGHPLDHLHDPHPSLNIGHVACQNSSCNPEDGAGCADTECCAGCDYDPEKESCTEVCPNCEIPCGIGSCCYPDATGSIECLDNVEEENCLENYNTHGTSVWHEYPTSCLALGCSEHFQDCTAACCADLGWPWGQVACIQTLSCSVTKVFPDPARPCSGCGEGCSHCYAHSFLVAIGTSASWIGIQFDNGSMYWLLRVDMPCGTRCYDTTGADISVLYCHDSCDPVWIDNPDPPDKPHWYWPCQNQWNWGCGEGSIGGRCDSGEYPSFSIEQYWIDGDGPTEGACCCVNGTDTCREGITEAECFQAWNGIFHEGTCADCNC